MLRFIVAIFAVLAFAFYELSGGGDFRPGDARSDNSASGTGSRESQSAEVTEPSIEVTRVALDLTSVQDVLDGGASNRMDPPARDLRRQSDSQAEPTDRVEISAAPTGSAQIIPSLIQNAQPETSTGPEADESAARDLRIITGSRVNVRDGPGTNYEVVSRMVQGDTVEVLEDFASGWIRIRPEGGGKIGWIADFLISER